MKIFLVENGYSASQFTIDTVPFSHQRFARLQNFEAKIRPEGWL